MSNSHQTVGMSFIRQHSRRVIGFAPVNVAIGGSLGAGLLLSQLMYWSSKMNFQEFFKTDAELCEETYLSLKELKGAKSKLVERGIIQIKRKGIPAKSHYFIDLEVYEKSLIEHDKATLDNGSASYDKRAQLDMTKGHNCTPPKGITNIEQKITQKTTQDSFKKNYTKKSLKIDLEDLSVDHIREWLSEKRMMGKFIHVDENQVLEQFKDYCRANGKQYKDYVAAYRNAFSWSRFESKPKQSNGSEALDHAFREGLRKTIPGQGGIRDIFELE